MNYPQKLRPWPEARGWLPPSLMALRAKPKVTSWAGQVKRHRRKRR